MWGNIKLKKKKCKRNQVPLVAEISLPDRAHTNCRGNESGWCLSISATFWSCCAQPSAWLFLPHFSVFPVQTTFICKLNSSSLLEFFNIYIYIFRVREKSKKKEVVELLLLGHLRRGGKWPSDLIYDAISVRGSFTKLTYWQLRLIVSY